MQRQPTCGQGLAETSGLPSKLGEIASALADNLEAHLKTLEVADDDAREEHDVYAKLVRQLRTSAEELESAGREMAGARDLHMGKHHGGSTPDPEVLEAFERLVRAKRELMALLTTAADDDQRMLVRMAAAATQAS